MKLLLIFSLVCTSCEITGKYSYSKQGLSEKHRNETVLTYSGKINEIEYKIYNKINFDPNHPDKPPYYEASHEIWFW